MRRVIKFKVRGRVDKSGGRTGGGFVEVLGRVLNGVVKKM